MCCDLCGYHFTVAIESLRLSLESTNIYLVSYLNQFQSFIYFIFSHLFSFTFLFFLKSDGAVALLEPEVEVSDLDEVSCLCLVVQESRFRLHFTYYI